MPGYSRNHKKEKTHSHSKKSSHKHDSDKKSEKECLNKKLYSKVMNIDLNKVEMNDTVAKQVEALWKEAFPGATILPVIGWPSNSSNGQVMTLTHGMPGMPPLRINGLASASPLSNNALYSAEVSGGKYINLYEIMLPDVPGTAGSPSSAQRYVNELGLTPGINVNGFHFHWTGAQHGEPYPVLAIHHSSQSLHPIEFTIATIKAIKSVM